MEWIDGIIEALQAGAVAGATSTCSQAVKDAYDGFKRVIKRLFGDKKREAEGELLLGRYAKKPETWEAPLRESLIEIGADSDTQVITAVKDLMNLLGKEENIQANLSANFQQAQTFVQAHSIEHLTLTVSGKSGRGSGGDGDAGNNLRLPERLTLTEEETDCMLRIAIRPEVKYPICKHPAITHASGTAVAALVTRALAQEIDILINRFRNCGRHIAVESEPCAERVEEFVFELAALIQDLKKIAKRTSSGGGNSTTLIGNAFAKLTRGNSILCGRILEILCAAGALIGKIEALKGNIPAEDKGNWQTKIIKKFKKYGIEIVELGDRLGDVLADIIRFESRVKVDWAKDQDLIWDGKCRARPEQERECKCES